MYELSKSIKRARQQFETRKLFRNKKLSTPQAVSQASFHFPSEQLHRFSLDYRMSPSLKNLTPSRNSVLSPQIRSPGKVRNVRSYKLDAINLLDSRLKLYLLKHFRIWKRNIEGLPRHTKSELISIDMLTPKLIPTKIKRRSELQKHIVNKKYRSKKILNALSNLVQQDLEYAFSSIRKAKLKPKGNNILVCSKTMVRIKGKKIRKINVLALSILIENLMQSKLRSFFIAYRKTLSSHALSSSIKFARVRSAFRNIIAGHKQALQKAWVTWSTHRNQNDLKALTEFFRLFCRKKNRYSKEFWWKTCTYIQYKTQSLLKFGRILQLRMYRHFYSLANY